GGAGRGRPPGRALGSAGRTIWETAAGPAAGAPAGGSAATAGAPAPGTTAGTKRPPATAADSPQARNRIMASPSDRVRTPPARASPDGPALCRPGRVERRTYCRVSGAAYASELRTCKARLSAGQEKSREV